MLHEIQKLREQTGAGVMECKKAFTDSGGDFNHAIKLLEERGLKKADSKASRKTGAGRLESYIHNARVGVLLEVRCETDFVANSDVFKHLARELAMQIAAMNPESAEALMEQPFIKDESITIKNLVKNTVAKLGENIQVARFVRYEL